MLPLWDMLLRGGTTDALARHFQLSQMQAQNALGALLPAFGEAFRRQTADPMGLAGFMGALASGQHARYFEDAAQAFAPQGLADGQALLAQLFGSDALTRAVADHAARLSGVGNEMMRQMMPALATILMGGLGAQAKPKPAASDPFTAMMESMTRAMGAASPGKAGSPWTDNPWSRAMEDAMRGGKNAAPSPMDAWTKAFEGWAAAVNPQPEPPKAPEPPDPVRTFLDGMFDTGRKTQEDAARAMQAMFDTYGKASKP